MSSTTSASPERTFDFIVPIDLSSIFEPWFFIPGVAGVRDQTGPWDVQGQTRTVLLSDGSSVREALTEVERPTGFSYRVGPFPRPLGLLAEGATGSWIFTPETDGSTRIEWTYSFAPAPGRAWLVRLVVAPAWRRYAQQGLKRALKQLDPVRTDAVS